MRPWLCSNDHPREAGGTSVTHIANAHRTTIARPTKLPTFLLYSTVPVAQSAAVSLNLGLNMFGDAVRDLLDPRLRGGGGRLGADAAKSV